MYWEDHGADGAMLYSGDRPHDPYAAVVYLGPDQWRITLDPSGRYPVHTTRATSEEATAYAENQLLCDADRAP